MNKRLECMATGRVQMVMFRDFTCRNARKLGLVGTVKNNTDGTVSVVAEGEEERLKELLGRLQKGPTFSRVDNVVEEWKKPTGSFDTFRIIY